MVVFVANACSDSNRSCKSGLGTYWVTCQLLRTFWSVVVGVSTHRFEAHALYCESATELLRNCQQMTSKLPFSFHLGCIRHPKRICDPRRDHGRFFLCLANPQGFLERLRKSWQVYKRCQNLCTVQEGREAGQESYRASKADCQEGAKSSSACILQPVL